MSYRAAMLINLKRGLLILGLLLIVLLVVLYFWSVTIVEALLVPHLETRGASLEVESIRMNLSGAELRVLTYEEADLQILGLSLTCPWSQIWAINDGYVGSIHIEQLQLNLAADLAGRDNPKALRPDALVEPIAEWMDGLPIQALDLVVDNIIVTTSSHEFSGRLDVNLIRGTPGVTHLEATLANSELLLEGRLKVLAGGAGLALDFVASAQNWEDFQRIYLGQVSKRCRGLGLEVYVDSLGEARGFLDVSGYARWLAAEPDALSFTALADLGAVKSHLPTGELILQCASAGLASNGGAHLRAYAKGTVDSLRLGSWMQSGGDCALRVDDMRLAGELRVGEIISLSMGDEDWNQLLDGGGVGRFYLGADPVDAALLAAFELPNLSDDLAIDLSLCIEGGSAFDAWKSTSSEVDIVLMVKETSLSLKGLTLANTNTGLCELLAMIQGGELDLN
jgi:hypothetical protein